MKKTYCSSVNDVPKTPHFAVIKFGSIYIPGDARSESCPGHGYPASTQSTCEYIAFTDRSDWELFVKNSYADRVGHFGGIDFVAFEVGKPVECSIDVQLK